MAERWKQKPRGFTTVRRNGWWVRPGTTPTGGTPSPTTRSAARNSLIPREWTGSPGVIGNWAKEPRLDPSRYEWQQNPENDRWFARPRTELTGLDPQTVADVRAFDTQGAQQQQRIQGAFDQFVQEAEANRAQTTAGLTGLAGAMGAGYMKSDPTAATLAQASQASASAASLPAAARLSDLPLVARSEGISRLQDFIGQRREQRAGLIQGARQSAAEAEQARQELALRTREQNLAYLGNLIGNQTEIQTANIRANTATQDRVARAQTELARLTNQWNIAQANNQTSRANTLARLRAKKAEEIRKLRRTGGVSESTMRQWGKRASEMWDGIPRTETERYVDDKGVEQTRQVTKYIQYTPNEIVRALMAQGATRAQALRVMRAATGQARAGAPPTPSQAGTMTGWLR